MMPSKPPVFENARAKPYPRHCGECKTVAVEPAYIPYTANVKHDNEMHQIVIPHLHVDRCGKCQEIFFTNVTDEQITSALRMQLGLLHPDEMLAGLARQGMTERAFAESLGVAPENVARWLSGENVQSSAVDRRMRLCLATPLAREATSAGPRMLASIVGTESTMQS